MKFTLPRHAESAYATYGRLYDAQGAPVCVTLELPWLDADHDGRRDTGRSRVVPGTYRAIRRMSPKRGYPVWWLCGVPDVTLAGFPDEPTCTTAQIHRAAFPSDLLGCIGVGEIFMDRPDPHEANAIRPAIFGAPGAFARWMSVTASAHEIELTITDEFVPSP